MCRIYFLLIFIISASLSTFGQESGETLIPINSTEQQDSDTFSSPSSSKEDLIHPNPSEGVFHLKSITAGDDISVFDGTGRMVFNTTGEETKMKIDITHLEKGIYLVIVRDQNKKLKINQKVMIK
ncbi:MAG: hypothetical protein ACJAZC_001370 [Cryomorphaceae bacterium]|jgi:hypothetical protein